MPPPGIATLFPSILVSPISGDLVLVLEEIFPLFGGQVEINVL